MAKNSRVCVHQTEADLRAKIGAVIDNDGHCALEEYLARDLKVEFDWENAAILTPDFGPDECMGYRQLPSGVTFLGCCAGGDWEMPVFFAVYYDGKRLRAYVPTDGNPWNTRTKRAYGSDDQADLKDAMRRWPDKEMPVDGDVASWADYDPALIMADVEARLLPPTPPQSLEQRIASLTYRGCDEDAELFALTCHYCYKLSGLGLEKEAAIVCRWAEEMAKASRESEPPTDDVVKGVWG